MKKWLIRLAIAAALVAAFLTLRVTVLAPEPIPVTVHTVDRGMVEQTITNSRAGSVRARYRALLSPEIGGQVAELPFREGDRVEAGQIVLRLDDSAPRARLTLAERELEAAEAERERMCLTADRAGRELENTRRLAEEEILSEDLLDQASSTKQAADAACRAAHANASRARAAVDVARTDLRKMIVRAPFEGIIAELSTEVGEWVTPSPPALPVPAVVDLLDPSSIYVSAPMDEVDARSIHIGQPVRVTIDSHRDQTFDGTVQRVAPYVLDIQEQNRTIEVEVELDSDPQLAELLPGTSADVEIILEVHDDVLRVPTSALMEGGQVLLLDGETLVSRSVTAGLKNWDYTELLEGLEPGDRIVTSLDRVEVQEGAQVQVVEGP